MTRVASPDETCVGEEVLVCDSIVDDDFLHVSV